MSASHTSQIIEWNPTRGFGFVSLGGKRIFLHIRDFSERPPFLRVGDRVRFHPGHDGKGHPCATGAELLTRRSGLRAKPLLGLLILLGLPALALGKLPVDPRISFGLLTFLSALTWNAYRVDKKRARTGTWRIPEATLHGLELIGGWPGAFLAQRQFRHKTAKRSFQVAFWTIVVLHQILALDFLADWRYSLGFWAAAGPWLERVVEVLGSF